MKVKAYTVVSVAITVSIAVTAFLCFPHALGRLVESLRDLGMSLAYFFTRLFGHADAVTPTVTSYPDYTFLAYLGSDNAPNIALADTFDGFAIQWVEYWKTFISADNLAAYFSSFPAVLKTLSVILLLAVTAFILLFLLFRRTLARENNDYGYESKPLRIFKRMSAKVYIPAKNFVKGYFAFVRERKRYWLTWLLITAYAFNLMTIVIELFAFYFYIITAFDFSAIYTQVYKLVLDLYSPATFIPVWLWVIIAVVLLDRFRRKIGYMRLEHFERRDRGFINARPIVTMVCGTMGKGKTTAITDMALSKSVMFRDKAFELLLENDMRFPYFPWQNFENELKREMRSHRVYNLATCILFVRHRRELFVRCGYVYDKVKGDKAALRSWQKHCRKRHYGSYPNLCFGYDYERYGMEYDDRLKVCGLWDVLESYARLYFIYVVQSSLIIANYSIRTDDMLTDLGNFPLWNSDFFKRDSRLIESYSRHAHILDFDMLRLGRKIVENNPNKDALEFGVVVCTEIGKERGNNLELKEVKKKTDDTNQKNDLFNYSLKMIRHRATVDNYCFICFLTDEQRPSSWGADARDLAEVVHIRSQSESRLVMPLFFIEELLHSLVFGRFMSYYTEYRYKRADTTLLLYILKTISAKFHAYYTRIYNLFGVRTQDVRIEDGTLDGEYSENRYYLMSKKIYSKRFSTDCYSEYFVEKALRSERGISDFREYITERASSNELKYQNSYFVDDMMNMEKRDSV